MRNVKTIEADIAKLQAELADAKDHDEMRDSAVHILKNLGWKRMKGKWIRPNINPVNGRVMFTEFDRDAMSPFKEGDFVRSKHTGNCFRVSQVNGVWLVIDEVLAADRLRGVRTKGKLLQSRSTNFTPVSHSELMAMMNS